MVLQLMNDFNSFVNNCKTIGISLSDEQVQKFDQYYELLIKWNNVMNLTTITEFEDVCRLHFFDSLLPAAYFNFNEKCNAKLIDVGTGAGFPGVPLKIIFPELQITLADSLNKRLNFLNEVIENLSLNEAGSICTVHGRAEDLASIHSPEYREKFDIVCSRAVANLSTLSEYCLPFIKVGGTFIAYKSDKADNEIDNSKQAIFLLGGKIIENRKCTFPDSDIKRDIILISKTQRTNKKYPRQAGIPSKTPL